MKVLFLFSVIVQCALSIEEIPEHDAGLPQGIKTVATAAISTLNNKLSPLISHLLPDCVEPPQQCPNSNVTFWLYTRNMTDDPIQLDTDKTKLENLRSSINVNDPWKIIIHGYTKSRFLIPNPELHSAYFKKGSYNLISVDYAPLAKEKCYVSAVANVPLIATCTADMIKALVSAGLFTLKDLHVIGFSLGAQIAGQIKNSLDGRPGRVTGLDPASPLFDGVINSQISKESGDFVDIVHTNAHFKGEINTLGHIDFYVNGGSIQPNCVTTTCSHDRAPQCFAESINSEKGFWGIPCKNYLSFKMGLCNTDDSKLVLMGDGVDQTKTGVYYLQTNSVSPYALGKVSQVTLFVR